MPVHIKFQKKWGSHQAQQGSKPYYMDPRATNYENDGEQIGQKISDQCDNRLYVILLIGLQQNFIFDREHILDKRICSDDQNQIKREKIIEFFCDQKGIEQCETHNYGTQQAYYDENGTIAGMPADYAPDGIWINKWLNEQKQIYRGKRKGKTLTEEQIRLLEDIGIVWETGSEDIWYRYYEETRAFFIANQHLIVPKANNVYLNRWINQQRKAFQKGQLSKQQITMLENIGMQWELSDPWKNGYVHAQQYYEQNDNLLVPVKYECGDGYKLGFWIKTQRQQYSEGVISEDQIQRLESIGMVWNSQNHSWQNSYQMAKDFFEKHRHLNVLRDYKKEINYDLNEWFRQQREADRNGALTDDRRKLLEDIEFDWLYPTERA